MAVFNCPECGDLSHSNRKATYFWCPCGRPLTAADTVPGMPEGNADPPSSAAPPVEQPPPVAEPAETEPELEQPA